MMFMTLKISKFNKSSNVMETANDKGRFKIQEVFLMDMDGELET